MWGDSQFETEEEICQYFDKAMKEICPNVRVNSIVDRNCMRDDVKLCHQENSFSCRFFVVAAIMKMSGLRNMEQVYGSEKCNVEQIGGLRRNSMDHCMKCVIKVQNLKENVRKTVNDVNVMKWMRMNWKEQPADTNNSYGDELNAKQVENFGIESLSVLDGETVSNAKDAVTRNRKESGRFIRFSDKTGDGKGGV